MRNDLVLRALEARREQQLAGVDLLDEQDEPKRPGLAEVREAAKPGECLFCTQQTEHLICGSKPCRTAYRRAWKRDVQRQRGGAHANG